jgi:hypothetical protein
LLRIPILILLSLSPGIASAATLRETLSKALGDYCIPSDASGCTADELAYYNETKGKCECPCADQYYNPATRKCEICEQGTADRFATSCGPTSCGVGFELVEVESGGAWPDSKPRL